MDLRSSETKKDNEIKRKKNAEKVRKWREKQKLNTEKDEELKKKDRDRKKWQGLSCDRKLKKVSQSLKN